MDPHRRHSHLFVIRLWTVISERSSREWRGKIIDTVSGDQHYFRDWKMLVRRLQQMVEREAPTGSKSSLSDTDDPRQSKERQHEDQG